MEGVGAVVGTFPESCCQGGPGPLPRAPSHHDPQEPVLLLEEDRPLSEWEGPVGAPRAGLAWDPPGPWEGRCPPGELVAARHPVL